MTRAGSPISRQETEGRVVGLVPHSIGHERAWHVKSLQLRYVEEVSAPIGHG
jgi:hypothetical protein